MLACKFNREHMLGVCNSGHDADSCHAVLLMPCNGLPCCDARPCCAAIPCCGVISCKACHMVFCSGAVQKADLTVADRNLAMRSCNTGIFRTSLHVGRRLGSVRSVMSTRSFRPFE